MRATRPQRKLVARQGNDATIARGREAVEKVLQREGKTALKLEDLAAQLGFRSAEALFEVVGKDELSLRSIPGEVGDRMLVMVTLNQRVSLLREPSLDLATAASNDHSLRRTSAERLTESLNG